MSINTYFKNGAWHRALYKNGLIFSNKTNVTSMIGKHSWVLTTLSIQMEMKFHRGGKNWDLFHTPQTTSMGPLGPPWPLPYHRSTTVLMESAGPAPHVLLWVSGLPTHLLSHSPHLSKSQNLAKKSVHPLSLITIKTMFSSTSERVIMTTVASVFLNHFKLLCSFL